MHFLLRLLVLSDDENTVRDFGARMGFPGNVTDPSVIWDAVFGPCISQPVEEKGFSFMLAYDRC